MSTIQTNKNMREVGDYYAKDVIRFYHKYSSSMLNED